MISCKGTHLDFESGKLSPSLGHFGFPVVGRGTALI